MIKLIQPPLMILPWTPTVQGPLETVMTAVWVRLKQEDLFRIVFHERTDFTFAEFIQFLSRSGVAPQVLFEIDVQERIIDMAGLVWLSDLEQLPSHRRATGSFCYFRRYQTPYWTTGFGRMVLDYWYGEDGLNCDLVVGVTPTPNRAARLYSQRLGFKYQSELEGYSSFDGKQCGASIAIMSRKEWRARSEQRCAMELTAIAQ